MAAKWLELLKEIAPNVTRVGAIREPTSTSSIGQLSAVQSAARIAPGRINICPQPILVQFVHKVWALISMREDTMRTNRTSKVLFLGTLSLLNLIPSSAWAAEGAKALIGSWKLTGWTVRVVGETEDKEPFGPNPKGRPVMTPEGYWIVIITGANRQPAKTAEDKLALFDSVLVIQASTRLRETRLRYELICLPTRFLLGLPRFRRDSSNSTARNLLSGLPKSAVPLCPVRRLLAPTFLNENTSVQLMSGWA